MGMIWDGYPTSLSELYASSNPGQIEEILKRLGGKRNLREKRNNKKKNISKKDSYKTRLLGRSDFPRLPYFIEPLGHTIHDAVIPEPGTQLDATPLYGSGPTSRSPHHFTGVFFEFIAQQKFTLNSLFFFS
jgi:hypothetical protein